MELTSGILSRDDYLRAIVDIVEFLRAAGFRDVLVSYGFGCDCPDEELYVPVAMPIDHLPNFVAESEAVDFYRVGKDNLYVEAPGGGPGILFCHESDIHFVSEDAELVGRLRAEWSALGYLRVVEPPGAEVSMVRATSDNSFLRTRCAGR